MDEKKSVFTICVECCKDIYLKNYVEKSEKEDSACFICLKHSRCVNILADKHIRDFCRFLIRYHFPEYAYNEHLGGEGLPKQFYEENPLLNHEFRAFKERELEIEEFLYELFDLGNDKSKFPLYAGFSEETRQIFPYAIREEKSLTWMKYKKRLAEKNYFLLEDEAKETFSQPFTRLRRVFPSQSIYFRARIGYAEKSDQLEVTEIVTKVSYEGDEIGAPKPSRSKAGRANRQGVSFIYLSSSKDTAISEVRPHPGHYVSIGMFESLTELALLDLRFIDLFDYFDNEDSIETFKFLRDVSEELSIPILPEEQDNYLVTQFVSDVVRKLGYQGILFKSSLSEGHNLVAFEPSNFQYKPGSAELVKISNVHYAHANVKYDFDPFMERVIEGSGRIQQ